MSDEQVNRPLGDLLRELPRERAGEHFTARVLARFDAEERERAAAPWLARLAFPVAAAVVLIVGLVARGGSPGPERPGRVEAGRPVLAGADEPTAGAEARRLLAEIRREHGRLARELDALRELREEPVLYVGGDEEVDLVLDLGQVPDARGGVRPAAVKP